VPVSFVGKKLQWPLLYIPVLNDIQELEIFFNFNFNFNFQSIKIQFLSNYQGD
jgi:hypothetical protein